MAAIDLYLKLLFEFPHVLCLCGHQHSCLIPSEPFEPVCVPGGGRAGQERRHRDSWPHLSPPLDPAVSGAVHRSTHKYQTFPSTQTVSHSQDWRDGSGAAGVVIRVHCRPGRRGVTSLITCHYSHGQTVADYCSPSSSHYTAKPYTTQITTKFATKYFLICV